MEMHEKKKFMPTITNYLSDEDDLDDCVQIIANNNNNTTSNNNNNNNNNSHLQTNYAEWKKLQKTSTEVTNGKKPRIRSDGTLEPLGDISSSEEAIGAEDNEPIYKIIKNLAEKESSINRRSLRTKKKTKDPSLFLLFSRMKHLKFQQSSPDWTFSELCRITQTAWENIQASENEELNETLDIRIREYKELLNNFRSMLLPDASGRLKYKSWVSAAVANKEHSASPVTATAPIVTNSNSNSNGPATKDNSCAIPERLQNLVGKASVYHATAPPSRPLRNSARHSLFSYRTSIANNNDYLSETSLNYVANAIDKCKYDECSNRPVQDSRWDGQYCSAKCLINDCKDTFQTWVADQRLQSISAAMDQSDSASVGPPADTIRSPSLVPDTPPDTSVTAAASDNDEEIMQYLASPPITTTVIPVSNATTTVLSHSPDNSDDDMAISRDENLFATLQQHYFPSEKPQLLSRAHPPASSKQSHAAYHNNASVALLTDIDEADLILLSSSSSSSPSTVTSNQKSKNSNPPSINNPRNSSSVSILSAHSEG